MLFLRIIVFLLHIGKFLLMTSRKVRYDTLSRHLYVLNNTHMPRGQIIYRFNFLSNIDRWSCVNFLTDALPYMVKSYIPPKSLNT